MSEELEQARVRISSAHRACLFCILAPGQKQRKKEGRKKLILSSVFMCVDPPKKGGKVA